MRDELMTAGENDGGNHACGDAAGFVVMVLNMYGNVVLHQVKGRCSTEGTCS